MRKLFMLFVLLLAGSAYASKIVKNNTASPLPITDTGVTIPASGQYLIQPQDYNLWAASSDIIVEIGDEDVTVNDGSTDLSITDGVDHIKGFLPKQIQVLGDNGSHAVDVILEGGFKKMKVSADINIAAETAVAKDLNPDTWCEINNAGSVSDTVTLTVPDDSCSSVSTLTATEAGDVVKTAELVVADFNAEASCNSIYKATQVKDNGVIVIASLIINGIAERPDSGDFTCTATGSITTLVGFDNIISREKLVRCVPDKRDPRVCATDVTGIMSVLPLSIDNRLLVYLKNGSSSDMRVDGSSTPVNFRLEANATDLIYASQVRCFGGGNGIKYNQFLSKPGAGGLTNGLLFTIRSNNNVITLPVIKTTEDFKNLFSFPSTTDFSISIQAGADQFIAVFTPSLPFILQPQGTFVTDDYVEVRVSDSITSGISQLECMVDGFKPGF